MNDAQKIVHLGGASVFLNPIQWEEPFGIVTIEALACGTPVVACPRGELPNVIEPGRTGYLASDIDGLADAVRQALTLNRADCRHAAEERFSSETMVKKYDAILRELVERRADDGALS